MRIHTQNFKNAISTLGRQYDVKIYDTNESQYIPSEYISNIRYSYKGNILRSVMSEVEIAIPSYVIDEEQYHFSEYDTKITLDIGILCGEENEQYDYEYMSFGTFILISKELIADNQTYLLKFYDCMIATMRDYQPMNITYPITLRDYIRAICDTNGLTFANENDTFVNYDKIIPQELYLDSDGKSLGYTYRDVLDEIAQATASTICVNNNDLQIKYISETNDTINGDFFPDSNVKLGEKYGPINKVVLTRSGGIDSIAISDESSISENNLFSINIENNQILNRNDRDTYLQEIYDELHGLEYYIIDFSTKGVLYYELCDKYVVDDGNTNYSCVMLGEELIIQNGIEEDMFVSKPNGSEEFVKKTDSTDRRINQAFVIVDKVNGEIQALVSKTDQLDVTLGNNYQELKEQFNGYAPTSRVVEIERSVQQIQTDTYTKTEINTKLIDGSVQKVQTASATFDESGMTYRKTDSEVETTINEVGVKTRKISNNKTILFAGYVDENNSEFSDYEGQTIVATDNIIVQNYLVIGTHSRLEDYESGTGCFYVGG